MKAGKYSCIEESVVTVDFLTSVALVLPWCGASRGTALVNTLYSLHLHAVAMLFAAAGLHLYITNILPQYFVWTQNPIQ